MSVIFVLISIRWCKNEILFLSPLMQGRKACSKRSSNLIVSCLATCLRLLARRAAFCSRSRYSQPDPSINQSFHYRCSMKNQSMMKTIPDQMTMEIAKSSQNILPLLGSEPCGEISRIVRVQSRSAICFPIRCAGTGRKCKRSSSQGTARQSPGRYVVSPG